MLASATLGDLGSTDVVGLTGGMDGWLDDGRALVLSDRGATSSSSPSGSDTTAELNGARVALPQT